MNTTFRRICTSCGFPFIHLNTGEWAWATRPDKREFMLDELAKIQSTPVAHAVLVDYHSTTPELCDVAGARGIHMIRDPRDMLISAIRYHQTSDESWLDEPNKAFGGKTFRQKLFSFESFTDRLRFELDTYMGEEIERMSRFLDRPDQGIIFRTVRYEDLIVDEDMQLFHELCVHLGLNGEHIIHALRAYWQSSIFGEMRSQLDGGSHRHIRVARAAQWRGMLDEQTLGVIHERIGSHIVRLGYPLE